MSSTPSAVESRGKRILLVEDDDANRQMLSDYLVFVGYCVHSIATGSEFSYAIRDFQPNLILLDLKLPDVSGYALLETLNEHPEWAQIPVIVVSAFAFKADQKKALALGARQYLVKPVDLEEIVSAIETECSKTEH